jgi:F420-dependent oxidoreductase-like protein
MRIGLTARGSTVDQIVAQAQAAESDGFASVWFASVTAGDPLVAMALVGRATSTIELGTAVLQTYPCHPLLQANRVASVADAIGRGLTVGIGPSHESYVSGAYGIAYDHPGRNTEEYVRILTALLRNEVVDFEGDDWTVHSESRMIPVTQHVSVVVSALAPRLLRVAGELADGTILWMTPASAIESHVAPRLHASASAADGRRRESSLAYRSPFMTTSPRRVWPSQARRPFTTNSRTIGESWRSAAMPVLRRRPSSATNPRCGSNCRRW